MSLPLLQPELFFQLLLLLIMINDHQSAGSCTRRVTIVLIYSEFFFNIYYTNVQQSGKAHSYFIVRICFDGFRGELRDGICAV